MLTRKMRLSLILQSIPWITTNSGAITELQPIRQAAMGESVKHRPPVQEIKSLNLGRVKPMTYKIDTGSFPAWRSALIG